MKRQLGPAITGGLSEIMISGDLVDGRAKSDCKVLEREWELK